MKRKKKRYTRTHTHTRKHTHVKTAHLGLFINDKAGRSGGVRERSVFGTPDQGEDDDLFATHIL